MARKDPKELLEHFMAGLRETGKHSPKETHAFMGLLEKSYQDGALSTKTKELISVAIGVYNRCDYCIVYHAFKAFETGATREEIREAAMVAVAFGGGPSMSYVATLLNDSIEAFAPQFGK
jgi:AhpD family alkylhydroperoxidase